MFYFLSSLTITSPYPHSFNHFFLHLTSSFISGPSPRHVCTIGITILSFISSPPSFLHQRFSWFSLVSSKFFVNFQSLLFIIYLSSFSLSFFHLFSISPPFYQSCCADFSRYFVSKCLHYLNYHAFLYFFFASLPEISLISSLFHSSFFSVRVVTISIPFLHCIEHHSFKKLCKRSLLSCVFDLQKLRLQGHAHTQQHTHTHEERERERENVSSTAESRTGGDISSLRATRGKKLDLSEIGSNVAGWRK